VVYEIAIGMAHEYVAVGSIGVQEWLAVTAMTQGGVEVHALCRVAVQVPDAQNNELPAA
jgi:hypothetical protein